MNVAVVIPAFRPDFSLFSLVKQLGERGIGQVFIIDDGSGPEFEEIFSKLAKIPGTTVLTHKTNRGKGAALKTAFAHILVQSPDLRGVITADADGQHDIEDILHVAEELNKDNGSLILGVRGFTEQTPPIRLFGNTLTRWIMKVLFGLPLTDTQTGLRGIPNKALASFIAIAYDRYEYELEMLLCCKNEKISIREIPIKTIYVKDGSSHFNPLVDSMKIYFVLFRYVIASVLTALVDYAVFLPTVSISKNILLSTYISRAIALGVGYTLQRWIVFRSPEKMSRTFPKYIILVCISGFVSAGLTQLLSENIQLPVVYGKILSELTIYFLIFWIQKTFVFIRRKP